VARTVAGLGGVGGITEGVKLGNGDAGGNRAGGCGVEGHGARARSGKGGEGYVR